MQKHSQIDLVGPRRHDRNSYYVRLDSYLVPDLMVSQNPSKTAWEVVLDFHGRSIRRISDVTNEEMQRWLPMVADAMAVGSGRSSFGPSDLGPFEVTAYVEGENSPDESASSA